MAQHVDAGVEAMQPARTYPAMRGARGHAHRAQLVPRNEAELTVGQRDAASPGESRVTFPRAYFLRATLSVVRGTAVTGPRREVRIVTVLPAAGRAHA